MLFTTDFTFLTGSTPRDGCVWPIRSSVTRHFPFGCHSICPEQHCHPVPLTFVSFPLASHVSSVLSSDIILHVCVLTFEGMSFATNTTIPPPYCWRKRTMAIFQNELCLSISTVSLIFFIYRTFFPFCLLLSVKLVCEQSQEARPPQTVALT